MKLVMHVGTHKSGSTYLQGILKGLSAKLSERKIVCNFEKDADAHHAESWEIMKGNFSAIALHARLGKAAGASHVILTSEDFEGLLLVHEKAREVEREALAQGFTAVEWHVVLRDPGAYFSSLYYELANHVFVDPFAMALSVLARGHVVQLAAFSPVDMWFFCFDYETILGPFSNAVAGRVYVHDFDDIRPYPGWKLLNLLGVSDLLDFRAPEVSRRMRHPQDVAADRYFQLAVEQNLGSPGKGSLGFLRDPMSATLRKRIKTSFVFLPELDRRISQRFERGRQCILNGHVERLISTRTM